VAGEEQLFPVASAFVTIPAAGGRVLSARIWRPEGTGPVPAIVEFSPYRVFDVFRNYGEVTFPYWATRGYAVVAVDIAGSGASSGLLHDEYLPGEIDDACKVIDWCAAQDWCDGNVGASGFSWSAFAVLRASDRKPRALKAMVLGGVSEDGWRTDVHYLGGVPYTAQVDWAGTMMMFNALPPDPLQFGDGWREAWKQRLAINKPWALPWLTHTKHDTYWKTKASLLTSDVPLFLYAGLADKYATSVLRIAGAWKGPVRTVLGPWEHLLPNLASRAPQIGFLQEALRWWDRWLKDRDTGVMDEPPLRLWIGAPDLDDKFEDGAWHSLDCPLTTQTLALSLADHQLVSTTAKASVWQALPHVRIVTHELGSDLYEDTPSPFDLNAYAEAFIARSAPQAADVAIAGLPELRCKLRSSIAGGQVIARLIDLAPSGAAVRVTTGALLLGRTGETDATIVFQACGWRLKQGYRLVLVLTTDGWPTFWPGREAAIAIRDAVLALPTVNATPQHAITFAPPETAPLDAPPEKLKWLDRAQEAIAFAARPGAAAHETASAAYHLPATGTDYLVRSRFETDGAWAAKSYRIAWERPGFSIRTDIRLEVSSTNDSCRVVWTLRARDDEGVIVDTRGDETIPRAS
jgi:predicted acyl esterase